MFFCTFSDIFFKKDSPLFLIPPRPFLYIFHCHIMNVHKRPFFFPLPTLHTPPPSQCPALLLLLLAGWSGWKPEFTSCMAKSKGKFSEPVFANVYGAQESIPRNRFRQPYAAWRVGTANWVAVLVRQAGNRFLGSLKGLQIRTQYMTVQYVMYLIHTRE